MPRTSLTPPVRIRRSKIHGTGVFATCPIPRGRKLFKYEGMRISNRQAEKLGSIGKDHYLFDLENGTAINGDITTFGARVNHSCDPNCRAYLENGEVVFYSRRKLLKNQELTIDYSYEKNDDASPCQCGSKKCRGSINYN